MLPGQHSVGLAVYDLRNPESRGTMAALGHLLIFANFAALGAFTTWLLMESWVAILIVVFLSGLGSSQPARSVVLRT